MYFYYKKFVNKNGLNIILKLSTYDLLAYDIKLILLNDDSHESSHM